MATEDLAVLNQRASGFPVGSVVYLNSSEESANLAKYAQSKTAESLFANDGTPINDASGGYYGSYYSQTWPWLNYSTTVYNKIRLKLSEVETLRGLAKGNAEAKKILNKLAPVIEIEVDF